MFMWYEPNDTLDNHSWIAWGKNEKEHDKQIDQTKDYPPDDIDGYYWQQINNSAIYFDDGDHVIIEFSACGGSENTDNDAAIADAILLVNTSTSPNDSIIIDNNHPDYISPNSLVRAYYSMRDDGGQSKVPFHILQACHISNYTFDDNLGLLFAMGHDGLISVGTSNTNWGYNEFPFFLGALSRRLDFGEAFLYMANERGGGVDGWDKYILCGAGTLKSQAYKPYSDCMLLLINNADITTIESHFVEQNATINGMAGSSTTVYNNG